MAKQRNSDTEIWKDPWFRKMTPLHKTAWNYLCDNCDDAGVWKVDLELASFQIGEEITAEDCLKAFNNGKERVREFKPGYWVILGFIGFHYGELSEACNFHRKVLGLIKSHGIEGLINPSRRDKDKDIDKDKDKEEVKKEGGVGETTSFNQVTAFEEFWNEYPAKGRLNRSASIRVWCEIVVSREVSLRIRTALAKYTEHLQANSEWGKMPKSAQKWLLEWDDWEHHIEPEKPNKTIQKPEGRNYDRDNQEFSQKLASWKKEQGVE